MKQEIEFRDPVVKRVVNKFVSRSDVGFEKYGITLEDDPSRMFEWLNHLQEELMDALLYIEAAKRCLADEVEEAMLERINVEYDKVSPCSAHAFEEDDERMKIIAQNGNTGEHYEKTI